MGQLCGCPLGAALEKLVIPECKESFGQIQKVLIMRINGTDGLNGLTLAESGATKITKASVETLLSATDAKKVVVSPYINNPSNEPGGKRTFGGGNQTPGGIEINIGREPTSFTGSLYEESQTTTVKALKSYQCETIGVIYIDENGALAGLQGDGKLLPIPVRGFFVGDKKFGNYEEVDSNAIEWQHFPNWSDNLTIIKPSEMDFNALTDLKNPA